MYAPQLGRFVSRDPIGYNAGVNLGRYVRDNPNSHSDPTGLWDEGLIWEYIKRQPDRPIDPKIPLRRYNCAGLAFRNYEWMLLPDVEKYLRGKCNRKNSLEDKCEKGFGLKCIFYLVQGFTIKEDRKDGREIGTWPETVSNWREFHIVCMVGTGDRCCSKNGDGPIEPPGPIDSFPPGEIRFPGRGEIHPRPGEVYVPNFLTRVYCCPNE